jgi:type I site-specific restriction endonuclease
VSKTARNLVGCFLSEIAIVQGKMYTRGKSKRADYMLYNKSNIPIAVIKEKELKDKKNPVLLGHYQTTIEIM